jgi:hypothetical protein
MANEQKTKAVIRIRAETEGFRRAGIKHSKTPVDHPADSITKAQLAALKAEPKLFVQELDVPVEKGGADK